MSAQALVFTLTRFANRVFLEVVPASFSLKLAAVHFLPEVNNEKHCHANHKRNSCDAHQAVISGEKID